MAKTPPVQRCPTCKGAVWVICPCCHGAKVLPLTLRVPEKGEGKG